MHSVHEAHERRMNAVPEHPLEMLAELPSGLARSGEAEVLLLAAPRCAVLRADAESTRLRLVRAAPVPERADEEHHGAGRHDDLAHVRVVRLPTVPEVAPRDDHGRPVVLRELVD